MAPSVRNLIRSRTKSLFDKDVKSTGMLLSICEALNNYDLFNYFEIWFNSSTTATGNQLSKIKFVALKAVVVGTLFWSSEHACRTSLLRKRLSRPLADLYPDLVSRLHIQVRIMGNVLTFAFHGSLILRAFFVLYAKKTQKRYVTTLLSVTLLGIIVVLCGVT